MEENKLPAYQKGILKGIKNAIEVIDTKTYDFGREMAQDIFEDIKKSLENEYQEFLTAFEEYNSLRKLKSRVELYDTADMMLSSDYTERFKAEYYQVVIRYAKLQVMIEKWDKGELSFTPTCSREIYDRQLKIMADYIELLDTRSVLEGVEL